MNKDLQPSNKPVTDYELERIREELILDGCREDSSRASPPTGTNTDKRKGAVENEKDPKPSGRSGRPRD